MSVFESLEVSQAFENSITNAISKGILSHALIFEGADESTRLSAAKEIAAAVLCEGENKPCKECVKCKKVFSGIHPDLHILSKDSKSAMIKVDAVRELKQKALVYPNDGNKSVFIIDGAEFMNPQAQNALLKIFEEPAKHLLFILCCRSKTSLLDTIISRATAYSLGTDLQKAEKTEKEASAEALAAELLKILVDENEVAFLKKIAPLQKDKELFRLCLQGMRSVLRDAIVLQQGGKEMLTDATETVKRLATRLTGKKILELMNTTQELHRCSMANANQNLTVTRFSSLFYSIKTN